MNSASLCSLAGRYDNPIPTRFLAPIDCLKIPAQEWQEPVISSTRGNGRMMAAVTGGEMFHISCWDLEANFLQLKTLLSPQQQRQNNFSYDVTGQDLQN